MHDSICVETETNWKCYKSLFQFQWLQIQFMILVFCSISKEHNCLFKSIWISHNIILFSPWPPSSLDIHPMNNISFSFYKSKVPKWQLCLVGLEINNHNLTSRVFPLKNRKWSLMLWYERTVQCLYFYFIVSTDRHMIPLTAGNN